MSEKITKIEVQKRNKDRVNVYIDNEYSFACSSEIVYLKQLKAGKEVDKEKLEDIISEDNYMKAKSYSLKIMERSYKTEKQVVDKLLLKEYDEKIIARVMEFLRKYNFVNDNKYAEMYIKDNIKRVGVNKIKYTLTKRGIDEEMLNEKIYNIDKDIETEGCLKLAKKKYNILLKSETDERKIYKKLGDFLIRKGYEYQLVKSILNETIHKEDIITIKENNYNNDDEVEKIYNLAEKRYNVIIKSEDNKLKIRKKLGDYLLRRGYSFDIIKGILNEIIK